MTLREYPTRQVSAPITARGYIRFINLRPSRKSPSMWCCDDCGDRVIPSQFEAHAKQKHGWKSGRNPN